MGRTGSYRLFRDAHLSALRRWRCAPLSRDRGPDPRCLWLAAVHWKTIHSTSSSTVRSTGLSEQSIGVRGSHGGLEQISAGELSLRASHFRNRLPRCAPIYLRPDEQRIARRARLLTNNITAAHLSYGRLGCTRMEIMSAVSVEI